MAWEKNVDVAQRGGQLAGQTRKSYEELLGKPVVSSLNASDKPALKIQALKVHNDSDED